MVETNKKFSEEEHPWKYYSVFGKITVSWISPLVKLASSRSLLEEDVWPSPPEATVESLHNRFEEELRKERQKAKETNRDPSLIRAFYNSFGWLFITGGVLQLAFLVFQLGQPFLIGELVDFVRNGTGGIGRGLGLAFGLAGVSLLSSMSITTALFVQRLIGISVRASIMTSIYKHALLLTTSARATTSVGQTTNLMAIDSERLFWAAQFWHFLW